MIRRQAWVPLFYTLAVIWIYRGLWHHHGAATGLGWDTIDSYGPDLDYFARELREGRFSLWNPYDKGGYPIFNDPQIDRYYPFNWPFAAWGAAFGSSWWLIQVKVLAHHVVAATCMHAFLRTRGLSVRAALIGGLALIASAPLLTHKASIILWPLVWVPLVWIAIDAALAQPTWRRGAAVAAALALPVTAASPPGLFYALLLIAPYAVWRAYLYVREHHTRDELVRLAVCVGTAVIVIAPVLALVILPSRTLVELGSRDRFGIGRDFALSNSLPEVAAACGVFVRATGMFEMYLGASVVLLALCALVVRPRFDRGAAILWSALVVVGIVLVGGMTTPVLPWLVDHVPGFALLRVPGRYKLVCAWAVAAGAGYGAAALEAAWADAQLRRRAYACAALALVVAIVVVVTWPAPAAAKGFFLPMPDAVKDRAAWWSIVATAIGCALVVAAVRSPRRWAQAALGALALCALLDVPTFTFVEPGAPVAAEVRHEHAHDDELVARLPGVRDRWRVYDEFVLGERAGARLGIRDFRGYPAIDPLSQHRYTDVLDYAKLHGAAIVSDFNVRWVFARLHFRLAYDARFVAVPDPAFESRGSELWEAKHPAPLVAWYGAAVLARDHVLDAVRAVQEPDGARRRVVLEPEDAARLPAGAADELAAAAPEAHEGELASYEPDAIRFSIDAPRAGVVVLNEIMFPGWRVTVDGADAVPVRANYLLRAVWVGAGHHEIEWRFKPAGWPWFVVGYAVALAVMLAAAVWPRRRTRAA